MTDSDDKAWGSATWEGSRRAQLRRSLKLTPMQRLAVLEDLTEVSQWLSDAGKRQRDTVLADNGSDKR